MLNLFVVESKNTSREMVELAVINLLGAQRIGANVHYRKELAILAERFLESAKEMEEQTPGHADLPGISVSILR
jgi:hypothetical protein